MASLGNIDGYLASCSTRCITLIWLFLLSIPPLSCWYLKHLFEHVPEAMTTEAFEDLLPHNVDKGMLVGPSS
jgi:hypothetical protein